LDNQFFSALLPDHAPSTSEDAMFGSHKVKIEGELLDKVKQCAEACGYSSVDEFVLHALEKEVNKVLPPSEGGATSKEIIKKRLQGLGYIE
jgi:hypothetical protein